MDTSSDLFLPEYLDRPSSLTRLRRSSKVQSSYGRSPSFQPRTGRVPPLHISLSSASHLRMDGRFNSSSVAVRPSTSSQREKNVTACPYSRSVLGERPSARRGRRNEHCKSCRCAVTAASYQASNRCATPQHSSKSLLFPCFISHSARLHPRRLTGHLGVVRWIRHLRTAILPGA